MEDLSINCIGFIKLNVGKFSRHSPSHRQAYWIPIISKLLHRGGAWRKLVKSARMNPLFMAESGEVMSLPPQWGAADTKIKISSDENTEFKRSTFKAWSRSVYSYTCYAYCQEFFSCLFLPFQSIHLHFFQNLSRFFPALAVANTRSCVGPQNKIGHPAGFRFPCWVPTKYK